MSNFEILGIVLALVLTVIGTRLTTDVFASALLFVAWCLFTFCIYRVDIINRQPFIPRILWVALIATSAGLSMYYYMSWTSSENIKKGNLKKDVAMVEPSKIKRAIQPKPILGNLKKRATELSEEIMLDLYRNGWKPHLFKSTIPSDQIPTSPKKFEKWMRKREIYFRSRCLQRVFDIRDEFSKLHYRDERLDDFLRRLETAGKESKQKNVEWWGLGQINIVPGQIEEVADQLKILSNYIE